VTIWVSCWAHGALDSSSRPRSIRAGPVGSIPIIVLGWRGLTHPHEVRTGLRFQALRHTISSRYTARERLQIYRRLKSGVVSTDFVARSDRYE